MQAQEHTGESSAVAGAEHDVIADVEATGVGVVRSAFKLSDIRQARRTVLAHVDLMKNTRPTPSSRHLAGFHRFPALEPLHQLITCNRTITEHLTRLLGEDFRTIGLSDITINRSQSWHKDLLRGRFSHYMDEDRACAKQHGKVFKVIMYLQDSSSLQVVSGSHRHDISLADDCSAVPNPNDPVVSVNAELGDAVIIDICATHRGSDEAAFQTQRVQDHPRILISTVFGSADCDFTDRMELGNAARLADWTRRHR